MAVDIFYNEKNISSDYYEREGEYWDIIQRVLSRTKKEGVIYFERWIRRGLNS